VTYGALPRARGLTVGDLAVDVLTREPVRVLRIVPRDVGRTVRVYFEVVPADALPIGGRWVPAAMIERRT